MTYAFKIIFALNALSLTMLTSSAAYAQPDNGEHALISALDRAFKPGFLETRGVRKLRDGSYQRYVTTGDAIIKSTIATPMKILNSSCNASGQRLARSISAGRAATDLDTVQLKISGELIAIDRRTMWKLFGAEWLADVTASSGFAPLFATSHFAERATKEAEADPPFGVFSCQTATGATIWAAAIMPIADPVGYDLAIRVTPITASWIRKQNQNVAMAQAQAARAAAVEEDRVRAEIAHREAEEIRLKPFREGLDVGSRTNCGIVIAVRNPLVQVQLPPNISSPTGGREFWVPRSELTDATPPNGCSFGG